MQSISIGAGTLRTQAALRIAVAVKLALLSSAGYAQDAQTTLDEELEHVIVLGRGETRQVQSVTARQIEQLPAGTSPLKVIERMPGVNFQSSDPYGAYEWSTRITVRGFNQNRLGFTLDDVPLGDMTYGNHNGLHISRAIPSELVDQVVLSQGTGSIETASASNLGGAVEFFSKEPKQEFAVDVEQMLGTDSARRTFASVDSGEFASGTRATLSVADASSEKWKGNGDQDVRMYNLKLVQPVGNGKLTAYYNNSDRAEIDYQDLSYAIVERRGWDWDNWGSDWDGAIAAADACAASDGNDTTVCDDAYWNASGLRKDDLGYLALELPFGEAVTWKATGYLHRNDGQGLWGTPYVPTPGGAPLSIRTTEYDLDRRGLVTGITWTLGAHEINGGLWYETNDFTQARRFYGEPSRERSTRSFEEFQRDPMRTDWEHDFDTETIVLHLQDTWSVTESFSINAGVRSLKSENEALTVVGPIKTGSIETDEPFLPQLGMNWEINDSIEAFASVAKNARAFASSGTSGPFSTSAAGFEAIRDVVQPETSINYEAGLRFRGGTSTGLLALYHVDFQDRLIGITQCLGIVGCPSVLANVGDVRTNGIEAALSWEPLERLSWFTSISWNDSEYADDYGVTDASGVTTIIPVSGKQVPDAPEILFKSELAYELGDFFVRADINYTDERFYTYLNDGGVDAYTLVNAGVGYRFGELGIAEEIIVQLDGTNLTDKKYFSTIDSNGFVNSDPQRTAQTLQRGAPRQAFLSVKAKF